MKKQFAFAAGVATALALTAFAARADDAFCTVPGVVVATDASGDAVDPVAGVAPNPIPSQDVQKVYWAEPSDGKVAITLKVADLNPAALPNEAYEVDFVLADGITYFVQWVPYNGNVPAQAGATPEFSYGRIDPPTTPGTGGTITSLGAADSGATTTDGFITWTLSKSKIPAFEIDGDVASIVGKSEEVLGAAGLGLYSTTDSSDSGSYRLHGDGVCSGNKSGSGLLAGAFAPGALLLLGLGGLLRRRT